MKRLKERIVRRGRDAGLDLQAALVDGLEAYYRELARWNRKINLTAFELPDDGSDASVDRLLVEPVVAAKHIPGNAKTLLDIGSGGGSPAIPIKLARPDLNLTMVEVKVRKSVFLRQVSRTLGLERADVENARFEELLARPQLHEGIDVVSIRAVKVDPSTLLTIQAFLKPGGTLLNFTAMADPGPLPPPLRLRAVHTLVAENQSRLAVMMKQRIG
jgi:16S rRNA (guanine527-N7)-methyltransferase